jgi:hypothetical protein
MDEQGQVERTQRAGYRKQRDYARPSRALGILAHHVGHHSSAISFPLSYSLLFSAVLRGGPESVSSRLEYQWASSGELPGPMEASDLLLRSSPQFAATSWGTPATGMRPPCPLVDRCDSGEPTSGLRDEPQGWPPWKGLITS